MIYNLPDVPKLLPDGSYCPIETADFFNRVSKRSIPYWAIAQHLSVPLDRVVYFMGDGRERLNKKAAIARVFGRRFS